MTRAIPLTERGVAHVNHVEGRRVVHHVGVLTGGLNVLDNGLGCRPPIACEEWFDRGRYGFLFKFILKGADVGRRADGTDHRALVGRGSGQGIPAIASGAEAQEWQRGGWAAVIAKDPHFWVHPAPTFRMGPIAAGVRTEVISIVRQGAGRVGGFETGQVERQNGIDDRDGIRALVS